MARTYEKLTKEENIYSKSIIPIPKPEFIVLYNGNENLPDKQTLRLSDMYIDSGEVVNLELIVKVLNINKGRNEEITNRSVLLNDYEIFIYLIKEYAKTMSRDAAIENAIDDCIRRNVLKQFLKEHASEVRNMLSVEKWDWDMELAVSKEEGIAIGVERGKAEERSYIKSLFEQGFSLEEIKAKLAVY